MYKILYKMMDASKHYISIEPVLLARQWQKYKEAYRAIESQLPRYGEVSAAFVYKTHPLGGFLLRREPDSKLKFYFQQSSRKFLLSHAGKTYSRGLAYYPGLLKDLTDYSKIRFMLNTMTEITAIFDDLDKLARTDSVYVAMAQEYMRNYLLILYHAFRIIAYRQNLIAINREALDQLNNQLKSVVLNTEIALLRYCTTQGTVASLPVIEIEIVVARLALFFKNHRALINEELQDRKLIREVRELDSLAHIFAFARRIATVRTHHNTLLVGIQYGGIELPFAVNAVRVLMGKHSLPSVTLQVSHYSNQSFTPKKLKDIVIFTSERKITKHVKFAWVLDDSISTARSIQRVIQLLGPTVHARIGVVAFKVSNRYHHLTMEGHGGFNPIVARGSTILCQANYSATYKRGSYLNRSGVFDVNKYNLYKMLGRELL